MTDLKVGDRVVVDVPPSSHFTGTIVGEGRQKLWWNVLKDGTKHLQGFHKSFCRPEPTAAVSTQERPLNPMTRYSELYAAQRAENEKLQRDLTQQIESLMDQIATLRSFILEKNLQGELAGWATSRPPSHSETP
jgi:hypothetical protein